MKKLLAITVACVAIGAISSTASAGEVKGSNGGQYIKGSPTATLNGRSLCAYSGLNDEYYIKNETTALRTQSYGQLVANGPERFNPQNYSSPDVAGPISSCNPN